MNITTITTTNDAARKGPQNNMTNAGNPQMGSETANNGVNITVSNNDNNSGLNNSNNNNNNNNSGASNGLIVVAFFLVIVAVIAIILGVYLAYKSMSPQDKLQRRSVQAKKQLDTAVKSRGIDVDEFSGVLDEVDVLCQFAPESGNVCKAGFIFEESSGCCWLEGQTPPSKAAKALKVTTSIVKDMLISTGAELIVLKLPHALITTASTIANKKMTQLAAKAAKGTVSKLVGKTVNKIMSRMLAKIIKSIIVKLVAKAAAALVKLAAHAAMGPAGWALMVFDIISLGLDLLDPDGYNTFISNRDNLTLRNVLDSANEKVAVESGLEYPILMPISVVYPDAFSVGMMEMQTHYFPKVLERIGEMPESHPLFVYMQSALEAMDASEDDDEAELPDMSPELESLFSMQQEVVQGEDPVGRDKIIFDTMKSVLTSEEMSNLELCEELSSKTRIGISLSKKGADWWNAKKREEWFTYLDMYGAKTPKPPDEYVQSFYAAYTKHYRTLSKQDPGKADKPNMVNNVLKRPRCLAVLAGTLVSVCEKPRSMGIAGAGKGIVKVDATKFGVRYNADTGVCLYTKQYCVDKMGMKFNNDNGLTNCEMYPGQEVAETIFGTTITRGFIKLGTGLGNAGGALKGVLNDEVKDFMKNDVKDFLKNDVKDFFKSDVKDVVKDIGKKVGKGIRKLKFW